VPVNDRSLLVRFIPPVVALVFCNACTTQLPFGGEPMPPEQVATFLKVISPASEYDRPPKLLSGRAPVASGALARKGYWGYTEIEFTVRADGSTDQFRFMNTTAPEFAREAALAVQKWKFAPARKNGQPVPVKVRLPFTFRT
jgi:TonB family protein